MKENLIRFLKKELPYELDYDKLIEVPKVESQGDFSFPCFILSRELGKNPNEISKELESELSSKLPSFLSSVQSKGPFLNFFVNSTQLIKDVFKLYEKDKVPEFKVEKPQKILIEYPSPNTNKVLHLGHTRNMLIGNSLSNILKKVDHTVVRNNLNNDRGIAICKALLSYQLFANNKLPSDLNMKPDEFVDHWYVVYGEKNESQPELKLDEQAQDMLVKWESGDKDVRNLWEKLLSWVFTGYKKTFENYKVEKFDKEYFESEIYDKGKDIVLKALKEGVKGFEKEDDGAVYVDLEDKGFGKKFLLRGDGTTLYMTQDIYLAQLKEKDFNADKYVFIVGSEQKYHFNVLFEVLERLGFGGVDKNYHFAYGYVYDENGNKFSSRKGETIGADWLLEKITQAAKQNLLSKELTKNLDEKEINRRAKVIGFSALSFTFLKQNALSDMNFSLESALSFEGETGPYIQYTYARIQSILRKAEYKRNETIDVSLFTGKEISLIKKLKEYSNVLKEAGDKYKISAIANYVLAVSQLFNEVYQNYPIIKAQTKELKQARLLLAKNTANVLKDGLALLNIEVLDEM